MWFFSKGFPGMKKGVDQVNSRGEEKLEEEFKNGEDLISYS